MVHDCFALLGLPQSVLLDDEVLKDLYHAAAAEKTGSTEEINEAYAVLKEPSRRIAHLLKRHGRKTANVEKPGATLFDLFFTVGAVLKRSDEVSALLAGAGTALQRAGLTTQLLGSLDELTLAAGEIVKNKSMRLSELTSLAERFPDLTNMEWETLAELGNDFAFLTKWESEIQKRETRLQETLIGAMN